MFIEPNQENIKTRSSLALLVFALVILFTSSFSWGLCSTTTGYKSIIGYGSCTGSLYGSKNVATLNCGYIRYNDYNICNPAYLRVSINDNQYYAGGSCVGSGNIYSTSGVNYTLTVCTSENEAERFKDSVSCVKQSFQFVNGVCKPPCDSTKWSCNTVTENTTETEESTSINCFENTCFGGKYCTYIAKATTTCVNECGSSLTTETMATPTRFEGSCPSTIQDDENCSAQTYCVSNSMGTYMLYRKCFSGSIGNGAPSVVARSVGGGLGDCKNSGYPETDPSKLDSAGGSGGSSADSVSYSQQCLLYGIGCPVDSSNVDYSENENRTSDNGCKCSSYDGLPYLSRISCPDGSISVFYGSCKDWDKRPESSSSQPDPPPFK